MGANFRLRVVTELKSRGVDDVRAKGFPEAITSVFSEYHGACRHRWLTFRSTRQINLVAASPLGKVFSDLERLPQLQGSS